MVVFWSTDQEWDGPPHPHPCPGHQYSWHRLSSFINFSPIQIDPCLKGRLQTSRSYSGVSFTPRCLGTLYPPTIQAHPPTSMDLPSEESTPVKHFFLFFFFSCLMQPTHLLCCIPGTPTAIKLLPLPQGEGICLWFHSGTRTSDASKDYMRVWLDHLESVFWCYPYFNICFSFITLKGKSYNFRPLLITEQCVQEMRQSHLYAPHPWHAMPYTCPFGSHTTLHETSGPPLTSQPEPGWGFFAQPCYLVLCTLFHFSWRGKFGPQFNSNALPSTASFSPSNAFSLPWRISPSSVNKSIPTTCAPSFVRI